MSYEFLEKGDPWLFFDEYFLPRKPVFVVVGSYTGEYERSLLKWYKEPKVIIYEASKKNFVSLVRQVGSLPIVLHNKAVMDYNGVVKFYEYTKSSSHSHIKRKGKLSAQYNVECVSVKTILEENSVSRIDVLLMTIRGPESILLSLLDLREVRQVCFHWYNDFPSIKEIVYNKLKKHFEIVESPREGNYACTLLVRR